MRLPDRLQPLTTGSQPDGDPVRAQVGTSSVGTATESGPDGTRTYTVEEIRALILPTPTAAPGRLWEWRGATYRQVTAPIVRRRGGRDHHYTISLELA